MRIIIRKEQRTYYIALLCVIDILFFPYIRFLSTTLSMIVLALWCALNIRIVQNYRTGIGLTLAIAISVAIGALIYNNTSGITHSIVLIFAIFLHEFIVQFGREINIKRVLIVYILFSSSFALLYLVFPQLYFNLRSFWTMSNTEITYTVRMINRFTLFYSDPNNASIIYVGILIFFFMYAKERRTVVMLLLVVLAGICIISTLSVSGLLTLLICIVTMLFSNSQNKTFVRVLFACTIILLLFVVIFDLPKNLTNSDIISAFINRFDLNTSDSTMGGRTVRWQNAISNCFSYFNLIIGKGEVYDNYGKTFLPHSGYIYMLISYGLPSIILFHKVFFSQGKILALKKYIALIPYLIIMVMNTGFGDFRYMTTMAIMTAFIRINNDKEYDAKEITMQ